METQGACMKLQYCVVVLNQGASNKKVQIITSPKYNSNKLIHPKNDKILDNNRREKPTIDDDVAGDAETILDEYEGEFIAGKAVNFATN